MTHFTIWGSVKVLYHKVSRTRHYTNTKRQQFSCIYSLLFLGTLRCFNNSIREGETDPKETHRIGSRISRKTVKPSCPLKF